MRQRRAMVGATLGCVALLSGCTSQTSVQSRSSSTSAEVSIPTQTVVLTDGQNPQQAKRGYQMLEKMGCTKQDQASTSETDAPLRTHGVSTQLNCESWPGSMYVVLRDNNSVNLRSVLLNKLSYHSELQGNDTIFLDDDVAIYPVTSGRGAPSTADLALYGSILPDLHKETLRFTATQGNP